MIYAIILEAIGLLLIYLEFFLPGGVMAIGGGLLMLLSLLMFIWIDPGSTAMIIYLIFFVGSVIGVCLMAMRHIKKRKESLYLSDDQSGYMASTFDSALIGKKATAATDLKPAGHILIEGKQHQAISQSGYISKDSEVTVIGGQGAYFFVTNNIKET